MYIDTHCHLFFKDFATDQAMVIGNAKKAGIKQFIVPGVDTGSSLQAVELARSQPGIIFAAIGFHPYEANRQPSIDILEKLIQQFSPVTMKQIIVAVGEIGLDYHLYKGEKAAGKKSAQRHLFLSQLEIAIKHDLPVIMHCRDAFTDFFAVLDSLPSLPRGVIHCFSGGLQEQKMAANRLLLVGVDGNITYNRQLQAIIPHVPLNQLLLETDSPYLTPIPYRGSRNEPKYLPLIAKQVAQLQQISLSQVAHQTSVNAQSLFGLKSS